MRRNKSSSSVTIVDNDDLSLVARNSGPKLSFGDVDDFQPIADSDDDDRPTIVNAHEFLGEPQHERKERKRSLTPPRRTVQTDDDDVVYRDKSGKRITREQWLLLQGQRSFKPKGLQPVQELAWGKGLVQKQDSEAQAQEELKLAQQPLNRYDIDEDYDKELQTRTRWSDPMLKSSQPAKGVPNRFNIQPGYRWDGVIRGNGYEDRWIKAQSSKAAKEQAYYLNNIADM
ncbi:hypothetical protein X943_002134 [Babesia divergens]|uniref:Pre-mRNA-splicing factor CWC26 n=1 Tax=Babesia divergens TaxID=32595 RepID=A0AAD9GHJ3_BABDI|nr:hypothetical protein X943_002134 [Babesia divergens]